MLRAKHMPKDMMAEILLENVIGKMNFKDEGKFTNSIVVVTACIDITK